MNDIQIKKWEKTRKLGKVKFVLLYGALIWGVATPILKNIFTYYIFNTPISSISITIDLIIFPIIGILWGVIIWNITEKKYLSSMPIVKETELIKILVHDTWGFNSTIYPQLNMVIDNVKPAFYHFENPGSFGIYFKPDFDSDLIEKMIYDIKDVCSANIENLENSTLSKCTSLFTYEINFFGEIINAPMGGSEIYNKNNIIWKLP